MIIDGKPVSGADWVDVKNPARLSETVGRYPNGRAEDAERAVSAAEEALPSWRATPVAERAALLGEAGNVLLGRAQELAPLLTQENGKVVAQSHLDIYIAGAVLQYYAAHPEWMDDKVIEDSRGRLIIRRDPIGVCAGIVPWNYPVVLSAMKIAPALLAGNTAVIKGPEIAPLAMMEALQSAAALFPPGVLNILSGSGPEVGRALVQNPRVRKVAFTGSTFTGRAVMADAAPTLKRVTLELGGNDAALVLDDAALDDQAIERISTGAFTASGQICYAIKRVLVHRSRYDELVEKLSANLSQFVVGDGLREDVTMGPLNNEKQYNFVKSLIDQSRKDGLDIKEFGSLASGTNAEDGYFILPHLVLDPSDDNSVVSCEQFGPVLPIMAFDTDEEAVARANDTEMGLASSVWSADEERAYALGAQLEAGSTFINGHSLYTLDVEAPFGGFKHSGVGRELGSEGLNEYVQLHSITNKHV